MLACLTHWPYPCPIPPLQARLHELMQAEEALAAAQAGLAQAQAQLQAMAAASKQYKK